MKHYQTTIGLNLLYQEQRQEAGPEFLAPSAIAGVRSFHLSVPGYQATPLVALPALAQRLHLGSIYVKDESQRFGLKAFKCLGGLYAICRLIAQELALPSTNLTFAQFQEYTVKNKLQNMVFVTATDGNHGKGVAWAASLLGANSIVYMPKGSSSSRETAIRQAGASQVIITDWNYDETVQYAAQQAAEHGWYLVQDTAWQGYTTVSNWITQGYTTMAVEAAEQLLLAGISQPSHVFLQAGVGSMAGSVLGYYSGRYFPQRPLTLIAEPATVPCIWQSAAAQDGKTHPVLGEPSTIMAGLNCGQPNEETWPILRDLASAYAACPDWVAAHGMRLLAAPQGGDPPIIAGESGAIGIGLLSLLATSPHCDEIRDILGLNSSSVVLLFNTEGDTDPENYQDIVYQGKYATPISR